MFPFLGLATSLIGGLGSLFGNKGTDFMKEGWDKMNSLYKDVNDPFFNNMSMNLAGYFAKGGGYTEAAKAKELATVMMPFEQQAQESRTQLQNEEARAGLLMPSTIRQKLGFDQAMKMAYGRAMATSQVEQKYLAGSEGNKALAFQTSSSRAAQIQSLLAQLAMQQTQIGAQVDMANKQMGFNMGDLFGSLFGSGLGSLSKLFGGGGGSKSTPAYGQGDSV